MRQILKKIVCLSFTLLFIFNVHLFGQASLPVYRTADWGTTPTGWDDSGTGTYGTDCSSGTTNSSGQLNSSGDYYEVFFDSEPDELSFELRAQAPQNAGNIFKVEESADGSTYTIVASFIGVIPSGCETYTYNLLSTSRYVRWIFETKVTGNYRLDEVNISSPCSFPSTQATSFSTSSIGHNSMNVSWTRGDGDNVIVLAKAASAVDASPSNGTSYTANAVFGSGSEIGTGNFVVYIGAGTSEVITSLVAGTNYHFAIYEMNNTGNCYLTPALIGDETTLTHSIGDVIITEIMYDPNDEPEGEWFEIYNTTGSAIDLFGWVISDNSASHTINSSVVVAANSLVVLDRGAGCGGGDYQYSTLALANGSDRVALESNGVIIDEVDYSGFPSVSNGEAIQLENETTQTSITNDNGVNWCVATTVCSGVDIGTPGSSNVTSCVLPVELLSFTAEVTAQNLIHLKWITESEINNDRFIIERYDDDNEKYVEISSVVGRNTLMTSSYDYFDTEPLNGLNYYRLKQVDFDGQQQILDVIAVEFNKEKKGFEIYPIPFQSKITVKAKDRNIEIIDVWVTSIDGRICRTELDLNESNAEVQIDESSATGIYFLHVKTNTGVQMEKVLKK